ncbi:hypothetical protein E6R61_05705 [Streptomyces sp. LRa12]|uniref:hypothetical protein n=1 Tax=Streptomyces sp. LRa12 TaxID=2563107 RepID=UPI00109E6836|nr:hypothetical protein [Streptomyces sp. LRa12]THA98840.1 hypothetical protein E6R61_05705 [Streptomyces sp. LRa12]
MFASLLPGFRHFRTPFTVGAIVAFELWVNFGEEIPKPGEANGLLQRIYSLSEFAGRPIVAAVVGFLLYMLGDTLRVTSDIAMRVAKRTGIYAISSDLSSDSTYQLVQFVQTAFVQRETPDIDVAHQLAFEMQREFGDIRMRLTADHADIYIEHDRLDSEAEFRFNVAAHSLVLWCVLVDHWSPWFLVGFIVTARLYQNGLRALRDANAILVQSVVSGVVTSRVYERERQRDEESGATVQI